MHENAKLIFTRFVPPQIDETNLVLELGPDKPESTFMLLAKHLRCLWHTADINPAARADIPMNDEYTLPAAFADRYDVVFSANVIEHVRAPWTWLKELARVTKPGGKIITINPVSWPYHEAPFDCWRIFPEGMRALYAEAGLSVEFSSYMSFEPVGQGTKVPGRSFDLVTESELHQHYTCNRQRGGPVEAAFDCITIGYKPSVKI